MVLYEGWRRVLMGGGLEVVRGMQGVKGRGAVKLCRGGKGGGRVKG